MVSQIKAEMEIQIESETVTSTEKLISDPICPVKQYTCRIIKELDPLKLGHYCLLSVDDVSEIELRDSCQ